MNKNKELVAERIGHVELNKNLFTAEQIKVYDELISIIDRNPIIKRTKGSNDHNMDFCLTKGKIEPVRNFCLKVQFLAGLSYEALPPQVVNIPTDVCVTVAVKFSKDGREITSNGGSTLKECLHPTNSRAFHDAVTRAETRGLKRGLEAFMGFSFINMLIKEIFGCYEIDDKVSVKPMAKPDYPEENKEAGNYLFKILKDAVVKGYLTQNKMDEWMNRIKAGIGVINVLAGHKKTILEQIELGKEGIK